MVYEARRQGCGIIGQDMPKAGIDWEITRDSWRWIDPSIGASERRPREVGVVPVHICTNGSKKLEDMDACNRFLLLPVNAKRLRPTRTS